MDDEELLWDDESGFYDSKTDLTEHAAPVDTTTNGSRQKNGGPRAGHGTGFGTLDGHVTGIEDAEGFTVYEPCVMDTKTQKASWKKKLTSFENPLYGAHRDYQVLSNGQVATPASNVASDLHLRPFSERQSSARLKRVLCVLVAFVVCSLIVGVAVYLARHRSSSSGSSSSSEASGRPTTEIKVTNTFHGSLKVMEGEFSVYSDALANKQSSIYENYEEIFTTLVGNVYNVSEMGGVFGHCALIQLREGSVDVDFSLVFTEPIGVSIKSSTYITYTSSDVVKTFHKPLVKSDKSENMYKLDRFIIDKSSIKIEPVNAYPYRPPVRPSTTPKVSPTKLHTTTVLSTTVSSPSTTPTTTVTTSTTTELPTTKRAKLTSTTKLTPTTTTTTTPISTPPAGRSTNESECHADEFWCEAGVQTLKHLRDYCIKAQERCDGFDDCFDSSDELNCNGTCSNGGFRCVAPEARDRILHSKCTWPLEKCDGFADCTDKSDEENCTCPADTFPCENGYDKRNGDHCVSLSQRCNRENDCTDGSDEVNCTYTCKHDEFMCVSSIISRPPGTGICINAHEVCDGYMDCNDSSDEQNCHVDCPPGKWKCSSGLDVVGRTPCVLLADLCDRRNDCADKSDEANCQYNCTAGRLLCNTKRIARWPYDTFCYLEQERCNGIKECEDDSDEADCSEITCAEDQFKCVGEHKCIPDAFRCDKNKDCADGSDEAEDCEYQCDVDDAIQCATGSLNGGRGFCLPPSHRCNGIIECADRSDEAKCNLTCDPYFFKCANGMNRHYDSGISGDRTSQCIPVSFQCDRDEDCTDGSDEHNCTYKCPSDNQKACTSGMVKRWPYWGFCIHQHEWCDGFQDCHDASDELNCTHSCPNDHFQCTDHSDIFFGGGCLPMHLKCNRKPECRDRSDEEGCEYKCADGQFKCQSGHTRNGTGYCIPVSKRCDQVVDCQDSSDEQGCNVSCEAEEFKCIDASNGDTCISKKYECDRVRDCVGGLDEHDNCTFTCPEAYMFKCTTSTGTGTRDYCIPQHSKCDHKEDCEDGSDESLETCSHKCLKDKEFKCDSGTDRISNNTCIPFSYRCDRSQDCTDNSDEIGCAYKCMVNEWPCETGIIARWPYEGYCIKASERCDAYRDCSDGSDEQNCTDICGSHGFQCKDGVDKKNLDVCIPKSYVCDKKNDCSDGSDEGAECNYTCPVGSRSCASGNLVNGGRGYCVLDYYWCNLEPNCVDSSDETNCTCKSDEFRCKQGLSKLHGRACIAKRWQCDRDKDCVDGSDEEGCDYNCPGQIACENGTLARWPYFGFCYSHEERCDGYIDCTDKSDEVGCSSTTCPSNTFQCNTSKPNISKECINATKYCDRKQDCFDNSDELESKCLYECPPGEFKCESGALKVYPYRGFCINETLHRCDGHQHCEDESDERGCDRNCPSDRFFQCKAGRPKVSTPNGCIDIAKKCDDNVDCSDASDELDCAVHTVECPSGKIQCKTGTMWYSGYVSQNYCFNETEKCDGFTDCMDHSDEADCNYSCKDDEFQCGFPTATWGTVCIPGGKRCDGIRNCMNNADELGCSFPCQLNQFPCLTNGECLPLPKRCDRTIDCPDESDEMNCDKNRIGRH